MMTDHSECPSSTSDANQSRGGVPFPVPSDDDALHQWVREHIGVTISRRPLNPGHTPPFAYLCHAFFEGCPPGRRNGADSAERAHIADTADTALPAALPHASLVTDCIIWANRGGGKTYLGALASALDLIFKPGIQIRILAGSLEQATRMHKHLCDIFAKPGLQPLLDGKITQRRIRLTTGSELQLLAQSQTSVRGTRVQKLRCDEVELFDPRVWEAAQLTTRSAICGTFHVRGTIECFSTMHNPHGLMHRLVREASDGRRRLFKWGVLDVLEKCPDEYSCEGRAFTPPRPCPLLPECQGRAKSIDKKEAGHITIDDALRMKSRVAPVVWESEMLCLHPRRSDSVLPEFDPRVHVVRNIPPLSEISRWVGGMDFGYRNPTVVLWAAVDLQGRIFVVDERITRQTLMEEHIKAIQRARWPRLEWIGVDPAGRQVSGQTGLSNESMMRSAGLRPRSKPSAVQEGLLLIRACLHPADGSGPKLLIHQRCTGLIEAMECYHFDPARPHSEKPLKNGPDHAVDALRYLIVNLHSGGEAQVQPY